MLLVQFLYLKNPFVIKTFFRNECFFLYQNHLGIEILFLMQHFTNLLIFFLFKVTIFVGGYYFFKLVKDCFVQKTILS